MADKWIENKELMEAFTKAHAELFILERATLQNHSIKVRDSKMESWSRGFKQAVAMLFATADQGQAEQSQHEPTEP